MTVDIYLHHVGGAVGKPFGERKANCKVFDLRGRRHEHGIAEAVHFNRDRRFDSHRALG